MKKVLLSTLMVVLTGFYAQAQKGDNKAIEKVIYTFTKAGDNNDAEMLQKVLDPNYRVVMNRLFGSKEVSVLPKEVYVSKIASKEFGGDKRELTIHKILVNGNNASAQVTFKGLKMTVKSFLTLVKDEKGNWKLVSDIPTIQ